MAALSAAPEAGLGDPAKLSSRPRISNYYRIPFPPAGVPQSPAEYGVPAQEGACPYAVPTAGNTKGNAIGGMAAQGASHDTGLGGMARSTSIYYGPRSCMYSASVPVPTPNKGVVVSAEFPTQAHHVGQYVTFHDDMICNVNWSRVPNLPLRMMASEKARMFSNAETYMNACDITGVQKRQGAQPHYSPVYHELHKERRNDGIWNTAVRVDQRLDGEFLTAAEIKDFFSNPEAIMNDNGC